jgi:hypothetical protein
MAPEHAKAIDTDKECPDCGGILIRCPKCGEEQCPEDMDIMFADPGCQFCLGCNEELEL